MQISLLSLLLLTPLASAATVSSAYNASGNTPSGSIVRLDPSNSNNVLPANSSSAFHLLGVVVPRDTSLITVNPSDSTVQVASSGTTPALVSDVNGAINKGDYISVSPIDGFGMKAESGLPVIGIAQTNFSSISGTITTKQIKDKNGKTVSVNVGFDRIAISIGSGVAAASNSTNLNGLQKAVQSLTGRSVSTIRIMISLAIAVVAIVSLATLIYGSIYGSIISVGRNPLAKSVIMKTLTFVLIMAAISAIVAIVTIDFLLH